MREAVPTKKQIIIIGVLCVIALGLGYWVGMPKGKKEPAFLKKGLVAYYPFNGNAKDESGNGNDGEVKGASFAFDRHGNIAKGCLFDGRNDVINLDLSNVKLSDNVTISCWAKQDPDQAWSAGSTRAISIGEANTGVDFKLGPSAFICVALDREGQTISIVRVRLSDGVYSANRWMLYTMTYSGGTGVVTYLNGKQIASDPVAEGVDKLLGGSFSQSSIGYGGGGSAGHYKGSIDDVRIYNRALSEAEVKELYEFEKPKTQQASTATPPTVVTNVVTVKPKPTPTPAKPQPTSTRQLTLEEKKLVGTFDFLKGGGIIRLVLLDGGIMEAYDRLLAGSRVGGKMSGAINWSIVDNEVHMVRHAIPMVNIYSIDPDSSLTKIGEIRNGKRKDTPKGSPYFRRAVYKKIK